MKFLISSTHNKSLRLNSLPIFVLNICKDFFSNSLIKIINLLFVIGIFPDFCKIAKVVPIHKKMTNLIVNIIILFQFFLATPSVLHHRHLLQTTSYNVSSSYTSSPATKTAAEKD